MFLLIDEELCYKFVINVKYVLELLNNFVEMIEIYG